VDPAVAGTLYLRLDPSGRITELYLDGGTREVTPVQIRRLPLGRLRATALTRPDLMGMGANAPDPGVRERVESAFPDAASWAAKGQARRVRLKPPTDGLTPDFLRDVAAAYRAAAARGERPNQALADQTGTRTADGKVRTVERWVYLARKGGFLEPTRPGEVR
jgi:hypothetical protein